MKEFNNDFIYIAERLDKELNIIDDIVATAMKDGNIPAFELVEIREQAFERFADSHKNEIIERLYTYLKPMFDEIEKLGYSVNRDGNSVTLTNYSPAGEALNITLYLDSEDEVTLQLYKLYDRFDEEDHAYDLLEAKKTRLTGIPSIRELIDDAVAISDMYEQLYMTARNAHTKCRC